MREMLTYYPIESYFTTMFDILVGVQSVQDNTPKPWRVDLLTSIMMIEELYTKRIRCPTVRENVHDAHATHAEEYIYLP